MIAKGLHDYARGLGRQARTPDGWAQTAPARSLQIGTWTGSKLATETGLRRAAPGAEVNSSGSVWDGFIPDPVDPSAAA